MPTLLSTLRFKPSFPHSHWNSLSHQHSNVHPHAHKPEVIYSADFHIKPLDTQPANSNPSVDPFPLLSLLLPKSTPTSELTSATPMISAESLRKDDRSKDYDQKDTQAQAAFHNGNRSWGGMGEMKFRLLFMLWPALIGVSMSI
jgi:hypothetical protein